MIVKAIGSMATLASWSVIVFGITGQICSNARAQKQLLSKPFLVTGTLTYTLWSLYGWASDDWPLRLAQTPGALLMLVLVWQSWKFRKPPDS